ncbi:MAG: hypothetical protein K2Y22_12640 [Candidatus Obscuribacterales bacterium]|nr:hypothetical protein [Candidatus Obscuribacterales bacterium]
MQVVIDKEYLARTINHLENERKVHDEKFAGNSHHKHCLPRFDTAISKLKEELAKVTQEK